MTIDQYIAALRETDVHDDAAFRARLVEGCELLNLSDLDVSREFGVSRPTVTRWRNGTHVPHPAMRKPMYAALLRRARKLLQKLAPVPAGASARREEQTASAPFGSSSIDD